MRDSSQFGSQPQPQGSWAFGQDDTAHKTGLIQTDKPGVLGIGDGKQVAGYITTRQLTTLAEGVTNGDFDSVLAP